MEAYILDWLNLLVRWLHLITGIAWIGASFYFVMLDNSLLPPAKPEDTKRGVFGELWAVHGGGFYVSQKFLTGPKGEPLSEHLHWSKWEAYTTWLSGMGLLALIYWFGASSYLIDSGVMALSVPAAIAISLGFLAGGWLVYDGLCRLLEGRENLLAGVILVFVMACAWALFHLFGARAAFIHVGAMIGTIMVANVFFHIIPGQKRMVADIRAGRAPDPRPGVIGKQRSVHNTYFTLPVLFVMISNHYPMTYSHPHGWLVLGVIMLAGVLIRQFFVLRHRGNVNWALPAGGVVLLAAVAVALAPKPVDTSGGKVAFAKIQGVVKERCLPCHAAQPTQPGFAQPPKGVVLETPEQVRANAAKIAETVGSKYMPIANLTQMTDDERTLIAAWFAQGAATK
ncbi:MAG TPA: urate hydroxylase PuuD [Casimicrobiaceae bacterium]